jgi:glycosyltransferase involved in cell wall biosynthesis
MIKLESLRVLVDRTFVYYRLYGAAATLRKIASYASGQRVASSGTGSWSSFNGVMTGEIGIPHAQSSLATVGPVTARTTYVQELEIGFDSISRIELLCATYDRSNTSRNRIALITDRGEVLHHEEFSSSAVKDNHFFLLRFKEAVDLKRSRKLRLVLGSIDGTKGNCITAWKNQDVATGHLDMYSATVDEVLQALETSQPVMPSPLKGSLVYKIAGTRLALSASYNLPPCSPEIVARWSKSKPHILACIGGSSQIAPVLQKALSTAEVTHVVSDALRALQKGGVDMLLVAGLPIEAARQLFQTAYANHVPSIFALDRISAGPLQKDKGNSEKGTAIFTSPPFDQTQLLCWSTFALCRSSEEASFALSCSKPAFLLDNLFNARQSSTASGEAGWAHITSTYRKLHQPLVSIVTILYRKAVEIRPVLESYFNQTYEGPLEIVFVDDCSPDDSVQVVNQWLAEHRKSEVCKSTPDVRIISNEHNRGNCESRNIGIRHAKGDILVIIDADCMLNRDYIRRHVEAHAFGDCEVVIGPMNLETSGRDPISMLEEYETRPDFVAAHSILQDQINKNSFLNCITRNFSIKASAITEELFDPLFRYSADPSSGFGWEDVEAGARLYQQGARIKYVNEAFTIHVSPLTGHEDVSGARPSMGGGVRRLFDKLHGFPHIQHDDASTAVRSMRNFRRLFDKHPDLELIARRWAADTFQRIRDWMDKTGTAANDDRAALEQLLGKYRPIRWITRGGRRYRVLTYRWHVSHQYELYKLPFDFTLVTGLGSPMTDTWDLGIRPMPPNVRFVSGDKIDPADYDFAILHFDENVLAPENTNGVIGPDWGRAFKWFVEHTDLPKVAVCHGTPQFYGQYNINYNGPDLLKVIEPERLRLVEYLGDIPVVLNSHQAQREWQFTNSSVIWHGFDPTEFPSATYERGILSPLGPLVLSRPHYRGYFLYKKVFENFPDDLMPETLRVPEPHVLYSGNTYALAKYRNYVDEIRRYSVYFNPTQRSPMPRARGEPMMCGVVTVSAHNHDVDMFIKNGVNGFYSNDADELRDVLIYLMRNPEAVRRIGAEGRLTAMDVFNHDRYLAEWLTLISDLLGETVPSGIPRGERGYAVSAN